jgi:hypothetical protein
MRSPFRAKLCLFASLAATPAYAQADRGDADALGADAIRSSLTNIISLATLGTITTQREAVQITRNGADYLVRLPLNEFSTPADAAVNGVAHPLDRGMWEISSITFPATGTIQPPNAGGSRIAYSIGEQALHGLIDPDLVRPSSFVAKLGDVTVRSDQGDRRNVQNFERYTVDGTVSANPAGKLNFASQGTATNWHMTTHMPDGVDADAVVRALSGKISIEGLDRVQGTRLLDAARALTAAVQRMPAAGGGALGPSHTPRDDLLALVDAAPGLLAKFQAEETMQDIRFTAGPMKDGTMGRVRANLSGDAAAGRLNARVDIGLDELTLAGLSGETAAYIPHHINMKSVLAGIPTDPLMSLLRAATEQDADPAALQVQFMALLGDANARIGIETVTFDSGPMQVAGSARIVPRANGQLGADIHLSATGIDALVAQADGKPALQQALPMIFIAKGMGRPEGSALTWDIALGDGPMTINGVPFGQPAAHKR